MPDATAGERAGDGVVDGAGVGRRVADHGVRGDAVRRASPAPSKTFSSTATTQTITGLVNGTKYRFRVQAINAVGTGGYSTVTNPVTPSP